MKRSIIFGFFFLVLVLATAQALVSNHDELTHQFAFRIDLPFLGAYESVVAPSVGSYFALCLLLGGLVVALFSLRAVFRANRATKAARQRADELESELRRLRGPAEDDEVYRTEQEID